MTRAEGVNFPKGFKIERVNKDRVGWARKEVHSFVVPRYIAISQPLWSNVKGTLTYPFTTKTNTQELFYLHNFYSKPVN